MHLPWRDMIRSNTPADTKAARLPICCAQDLFEYCPARLSLSMSHYCGICQILGHLWNICSSCLRPNDDMSNDPPQPNIYMNNVQTVSKTNTESPSPRYFSNGSVASSLGDNNSLTKIFDSYRGIYLHPNHTQESTKTNSIPDDPAENPDLIGIERAMEYLGAINVQLDEVNCLAIAELLQCPSMGEITRKGFMDGWLKSL